MNENDIEFMQLYGFLPETKRRAPYVADKAHSKRIDDNALKRRRNKSKVPAANIP